MFKIFRIFFSIVFICNYTFGFEVVKFATVIYRHGDRTPVNCYPNDPYNNESLWPVPFGELTNIGKQQHYELGKYLRQRYQDLLSKKYRREEIYIKSTDVDRTIMSAEVNLAGMYPPKDDEIWNKHLLWQPVPVHMAPEHDDEILAMKKRCRRYLKQKKEYTTSTSFLDRLSAYNDLMAYLTKNTGMKVTTYEDINDIYSCLNIEHLYNFTLPMWTKEVFPDKLRGPACYSFGISAATKPMARLIAGPLMQDIVKKMVDVINGDSPLKLAIFSGHDFTVGTLLTALQLFDGACPTYTASIFIELVFDSQLVFENDQDSYSKYDGYYVRLLYRNSKDIVKPKVLTIPGCGKVCSLDEFIRLYNYLITVNWETECNGKDSDGMGWDLFINISMYCLMAFHFVLFSAYAYVKWCTARMRQSKISPAYPTVTIVDHGNKVTGHCDSQVRLLDSE